MTILRDHAPFARRPFFPSASLGGRERLETLDIRKRARQIGVTDCREQSKSKPQGSHSQYIRTYIYIYIFFSYIYLYMVAEGVHHIDPIIPCHGGRGGDLYICSSVRTPPPPPQRSWYPPAPLWCGVGWFGFSRSSSCRSSSRISSSSCC